MNYLGAIILSLVILILGILFFSKNGVSGPEFFNMVTGSALVIAAFYAHRTWRKTEHWKVKKEVFSYLIRHKSKIVKFQAEVAICIRTTRNYIDSDDRKILFEDPMSKRLSKLTKIIEGKIRSKIAIADLGDIASNLSNYLISTDLKWSRAFTDDVYNKMVAIFTLSDGSDCFSRLFENLEYSNFLADIDDPDDDYYLASAKAILANLESIRTSLHNFEKFMDQIIDFIELKLGSTL